MTGTRGFVLCLHIFVCFIKQGQGHRSSLTVTLFMRLSINFHQEHKSLISIIFYVSVEYIFMYIYAMYTINIKYTSTLKLLFGCLTKDRNNLADIFAAATVMS